MLRNGTKKRGFTLIELLVVIAIIALLLSIVMPGLSLAKQKAASIVCMANVKNLSLGWFSYKEDNNNRIMSSEMDGIKIDGRDIPGWINTPHTEANANLSPTSSNVVTDADEIRGIEDGALYPYLDSPGVYNCPSDKVKSLFDNVDPEKFVTYAMPSCLAGVNGDGTNYYRITKFHEIKSPSDRYNFVETAQERNYTIGGHFMFGGRELTSGAPAVLWDPVAVNHGDSSVLGFCDGHAERHKWQDKNTLDRVDKLTSDQQNYSLDLNGAYNSSNSEDIAYIDRGWPYRYKK